MENGHIESLLSFLRTPLDSGDEIFARFAALPGAIVGKGDGPLARFVYIPGTRKDRVVLIAHADTVWDKSYKRPYTGTRDVIFESGVFISANPDCGIGADDRAGCAMLWELRECGHSLLLTDGEEHGMFGAKYLKTAHKPLFRELSRHRFMIELDWAGTNRCLYKQVDNTKRFKKYISENLGFREEKGGGTDLRELCKRICGVNVGVGYRDFHKNSEALVLADWENTLDKLTAFLERKQKRFPIATLPPCIRLAKRCVKKILTALHIPFPKKQG